MKPFLFLNPFREVVVILAVFSSFIASCKKDNGDNDNSDTGKKAYVSTIAGSGAFGFLDGPAASAKFYHPYDIAVQSDGSLVVTDHSNFRIRKIKDGQVSTYAGNGNYGIGNGEGNIASFRDVSMIANDGSGTCYVLDRANFQVRRITSTSLVSLYACTGVNGLQDGPVATAKMSQSWGILVDFNGNVIFADTYNHRIRKVSTDGQVTTIAGSGIEGYADGNAGVAQFNEPYGIAMDKQGNIYVADFGNRRIRKITSAGVVSTVAGSGVEGETDGKVMAAEFAYLHDLVVDSRGHIYVADEHRVRMITPDGTVTTIAGGAAGDADGEGTDARFNNVKGLVVDAANNIYVADASNHKVKKISFR